MPFPFGDTMATMRPVQAPMVCRSGTPIVRPLNMSWRLNTSIRIGWAGLKFEFRGQPIVFAIQSFGHKRAE